MKEEVLIEIDSTNADVKTLCGVFNELVSEYTENGSLHGIKYAGDRRRHWFERSIWITIFFISTLICFSFIQRSYEKWQRTPIITSVDEHPTLTSEIPFPAVTVCPNIHYNNQKFAFRDIMEKHTKIKEPFANNQESVYVSALLQICSASWFDEMIRSDISNLSTLTCNPTVALKQLSIPIEESFFLCSYKGVDRECKPFLKTIFTHFGVCYTFNILEAEKIFRVEAVDKELLYDSPMFPKNFSVLGSLNRASLNVLNFDAEMGMSVNFSVETNDYDSYCTDELPGINVLVHSPEEIPNIAQRYLEIQANQQVDILIKPKLSKTFKGLRKLAPQKRNCYFKNERFLRYFEIYTQHNCEMECWSNITLEQCGCVKFFMPRDNQSKVCGLEQRVCAKKTLRLVRMSGLSLRQRSSADNCNCIPNCKTVEYKTEISHINLEPRFENGTIKSRQWVKFDLHFGDFTFIASTRSELFDKTDFLACSGGILGLFIGFSILSIVEFIYHFTVRLSINLNRYRKARKIATTPVLSAIKSNTLDVTGID